MTGITLYALFGDDFRISVVPKSGDNIFYAISTVALALFIIEFLINTWARLDYKWKFYFWLDLAASLSMVPDIAWIWDPISEESAGGDVNTVRAGRAARAGSKAGRVIRIVRLIRLIRIVKLYKQLKKTSMQKRRKSSKVCQLPVLHQLNLLNSCLDFLRAL